MSKHFKVDKQCSALYIIPQEIVVGNILPFMDEMTVYCLHMTAVRFRGLYRHLRPWDDQLVHLPYPLWSFVRLRWCPMCDSPYTGKEIDLCYGHISCYGYYGYHKRTPKVLPIGKGLMVIGPDFNFCLEHAEVTRDMYFGAYPEDDATRASKLNSALTALHHAERHRFIKSLDKKVQLAPGVKVDYSKMWTNGGRKLHDIKGGQWGLIIRDANRSAKLMWDWWKKSVRPKFIWKDDDRWHKTMEKVTSASLTASLLHNLADADLKYFQDEILRHLPLYIKIKLKGHVLDTGFKDLGRVMCHCDECSSLRWMITEVFEKELSRDNLALGTGRGVGGLFGGLVHKSPEIHRKFTAEVSKAFIACFRILRQGPSSRFICTKAVKVAYEYILGELDIEDFERDWE